MRCRLRALFQNATSSISPVKLTAPLFPEAQPSCMTVPASALLFP